MISREISANEQPSQTDPAPLMEVLFEEVQDTVILDVAQVWAAGYFTVC